MNNIKKSISQVFHNGLQSFSKFPAAMGSALAFALVTMVRIQIDWPQQEAYNFLFNCLHLAFAFGSIFGLAAVTFERVKYKTQKTFSIANIVVVIGVAAAFSLLYAFGKTNPDLDYARIVRVKDLAAARISVAMLISFLGFIVFASYPKEESSFSKALFMVHKAFFTALIYGGVIEGGASAVAGAIQGLLYNAMSYKVYMYIATVAGFVAYAIFVGYFPEFGKGEIDEKRETAQKQPRFIEVLFEYILVPIALALTVVLLLWSGKTIIASEEVNFVRLSGIATSYAFIGIWLHIMLSDKDQGLAGFYKKVYPFAALVIMGFEARALFVQLSKWGLKTTEYSFILMWIFVVVTLILLIIKGSRAHIPSVILLSILALIAVTPIIGYYSLPVTIQVGRLEKMLTEEGLLVNEKLTPAPGEIPKERRIAITDSVDFLIRRQDNALPDWFDKKLEDGQVFKEKLGFDKTWPEPDFEPGLSQGTYLSLPTGALDIGDYRWAINMMGSSKGSGPVTLDGQNGQYKVYWEVPQSNIPSLKIELNDKTIIQQNMNIYFDRIIEKYPPGESPDNVGSFEDMTLKLSSKEVDLLLMFEYVNISLYPEKDDISYWLDIRTIYMNEK